MSYAQFVTQRRLRRMGAYDGFGGFPSPAFLYTAGDSFAALGMTTTRADASTCARYRDQAGTWQLAAANVPRDQHWQYGASWPTLLREGASTNSALGACSFADDTYWAGSASFTIATATSCIAGQTAYKHTDAAGGAVRTQDRGIFVNGQTDTEWFCLEDTGDGNAASDITIYDATVGAALYTARVTWATKTIATTAGTGTPLIINDGNGRYRCAVSAAGVAAGAVAGGAGNTRQLRIAPVITAGKSCIIHIGALEAATAYPSSPIVTVAGAVTRAADLISVPWTRNPEAGTWYFDAYDLNTGTGTKDALFIGAAAPLANPYFRMNRVSATGLWNAISVNSGAVGSQSIAAAATSFGQRVEGRGVFAVSGGNFTVAFGQALSGGAEVVAATGNARAIDAAWGGSPPKLYIGSMSDASDGANLAIRALCYVPWPEQSMQNFRIITGLV